MKVSRTKWHYRLNCWVAQRVKSRYRPDDHCHSLCQYFWYTVGGVILAACYSPMLVLTAKIPGTFEGPIEDKTLRSIKEHPLLAVFCIILGTLAAAVVLLIAYFWLGVLLSLGLALVLGSDWLFVPLGREQFLTTCALTGFFTFFGLLICADDIWKKAKNRYEDSDNIAVEYVKAVKKRVCPLMEYVD
jgi:hypothetical protein